MPDVKIIRKAIIPAAGPSKKYQADGLDYIRRASRLLV